MSSVLWLLLVGWTGAPATQPDPPQNIQQTIDYLHRLQTESGGFLPQADKGGAKSGEPTLRATSAAVRAVKYFGGKLKKKDAAAKFVASCHDAKSGGFANMPGGKADVFATAVGLMAVAELGMPMDKYKDDAVKFLSEQAVSFDDIRIAVAGLEAIKAKAPKADAWLELIQKMQNKDGTFGNGKAAARDTGGAVVAILRLGGEVKNKEAVLKILKEGQHPSGAWSKDDAAPELESSYRVMRAFHMLKALPDDVEAVRTYIEKCRNADGGYSVAPNQESSVSGCYYAAIIRHWIKGK